MTFYYERVVFHVNAVILAELTYLEEMDFILNEEQNALKYSWFRNHACFLSENCNFTRRWGCKRQFCLPYGIWCILKKMYEFNKFEFSRKGRRHDMSLVLSMHLKKIYTFISFSIEHVEVLSLLLNGIDK